MITGWKLAICLALCVVILTTLADLAGGPGSVSELRRLDAEIAHMEAVNDGLRRQNHALLGEIAALTSGMDAIEEQAREQLGMVRKGETFYLLDDNDRLLSADAAPSWVRRSAAQGQSFDQAPNAN